MAQDQGVDPGLSTRKTLVCIAPARLVSLRGATVVDFVVSRTSSFNRVQYQRESRLLKTQEL